MTVRRTHFMEINHDLIQLQLFEALKKQKDALSIFAQAIALFDKGKMLFNQQKYTEAITIFEEAANISHNLGIFEFEYMCWSYISAIAYTKTFDHSLIIKSCHRKLELSSDPLKLASAHNCLATTYLAKCEFQKSLEHSFKILDLISEIKDEKLKNEFYRSTIYNIGEAYLRLENYEKAIDYISKALKMFEESKDIEGQGKALSGLGMLYFHKKQYQTSLKYLNRALLIFEKAGNQEEIAETLKALALTYAGLGQIDKSVELFTKAASIHRELGQTKFATDALRCAATLDKMRKQMNGSDWNSK